MTKLEKLLLLLTGASLLLSAVLTLWPEKALSATPVYQSIQTPAPPPEEDALWLDMSCSIDLNHADAGELEALPGIGETLAKRIVAYRSLHGPFQRVEDLMKVDGIHESTLDGILAVAAPRE